MLTESIALDSSSARHHAAILAKEGTPFVSLTLWGDGIPYSWDRKKSVDTWTLSLPGLSKKEYRDLRISLTALPHHCVIRETQDDVLNVLAWSFRMLSQGQYPHARHDGQEWASDDAWRKRRSGQPLLKAFLLEVKGDWKQLTSCFDVPSWSGRGDAPICWRCKATKNSLREERGPDSAWLQQDARLSHIEALGRIAEAGGTFSPLWSTPYLKMDALRLDWLHVCDQGISPVFLGGLFHMLLADRSLGHNAEERCAALWANIQEFYGRQGTQDKLHSLVVTMIKPKKGSIELNGNGAQIRALIPFGLEVVNAWPEAGLNKEMVGARAAMRSLSTCYSFLSVEQPAQGTLLQHALAFQANLQGLHAISNKRWQLRPKLHLFLEMAAEGANPSSSWNYRDESFGGSVSRQARVKGGITTPLGMSKSMLTKFCAKESLPKIV